jgi:hypothetical protein
MQSAGIRPALTALLYRHAAPRYRSLFVDVTLAILQGAGLATAAGIRPFLPALVAGALATRDLGVDFTGTDFAFLETTAFLLAIVLVLIATVIVQRRRGPEAFESGPLGAAVQGIGAGLGAVLFAGSMADLTSTWWPGIIGGLLCATLASVTVRDLFARVARRLDDAARNALPVYADGTSLILACLAVLIPPISIIAIGGLLVLLVRGRSREGEKYAGLRILR